MPASVKELIKKAEALGKRHGTGSAEWYFDRTEPSNDDARRVLKGIRECDPAILDTFMSGSLSGEWADDMTPQKLYEYLDITERQIEVVGDDLCEAYELEFNRAYESKVESMCIELLRRTVTFTVEVEIEEQDEHKLLSDIENLLAERNCSLESSSVSEEGEVIA